MAFVPSGGGGLDGDFYCAPAARRGAAEAEASWLGEGGLLGDPYGSPGAPFDFDGGCDPYGFAGLEPMRCAAQPSLAGGAPLGGLYCDAGEVCRGSPRSGPVERFHHGQPAPPLPPDDLFRLERTSFAVEGSCAADVGDRLVDFLAAARGVTVTRVDAAQYSIRAEADGEAGRCSLKARLYDARSGPGRQECVVEFQRRGGDSTALWHVFCNARASLQGRRQFAPAEGGPMPLPAH
mmetsp:Transcript_52158/g.140679  ORF Transcript_52158/g.140679 Transcript_52158/m.140679 type:complete len:236 (-) Transcript_52158:96-803(-)